MGTTRPTVGSGALVQLRRRHRGSEPAVRPACRWLGTAKPAPGGVAHRERRRGPLAPILRVCGHLLAGPKAFRSTQVSCPRDVGRSAYYPVDARRILFPLRETSGARRWALGGHPETSAHPHRGMDALWRGRPMALVRAMGWLAKNALIRVWDRARGDGVACPEEYSGLAAAGVTPWSCTPRYSGRENGRYPQRQILAGA